MPNYVFEATEGKPLVATSKRTSPRNVKAFEAEMQVVLADPTKLEDVAALLLHMLPFAVDFADGRTVDEINYDDFDIKAAQRAVDDFLPSGSAIFKSLIGY